MVKINKDYVAMVVMCDDGDWHHMELLNNVEFSVLTLLNKRVVLPEFMRERIALMSLCSVGDKGGVYGRRVTQGRLAVYLKYGEYMELKETFKLNWRN
jgi:hypothetical protein